MEAAPAGTNETFLHELRTELEKTQAAVERAEEDHSHRAEVNRRLLQILWEVHVQFETIGVHLAIDPPSTVFATFAEYPTQWSFRDNFDFAGLKAIELGDRAPGWIGFTLRFAYYRDGDGVSRLRGTFEWCDGESYHRYAGWMRTMSQAIVYDAPDEKVDLDALQSTLKELVVQWYAAHLEKSTEPFVRYLKGKFPPGPTYSKESYR